MDTTTTPATTTPATTTPATDDARDEAARALQTALDRRDNGGSPTR